MPTIFDFEIFNITTGQVHRRGPATQDAIARIGGTIDAASGFEVTDDDLDGNGFLKPPRLGVARKLPDQRVTQIVHEALAPWNFPLPNTNGSMGLAALRDQCIDLEARLREAGASAGDISYVKRMLKYTAERAPEFRNAPDTVAEVHRAVSGGTWANEPLAVTTTFLGRVRIRRLNRTDIGPEDSRPASNPASNIHLRPCPDCGSDRTLDERRSRSAGSAPQTSAWMAMWTCDACGTQVRDLLPENIDQS